MEDSKSQLRIEWDGSLRLLKSEQLTAPAVPESSVDKDVISVDLHVLPIKNYL